MIILVDQDGVIFDYVRGFEHTWRKEHPDKSLVPHDALCFWDMEKHYPEEYYPIILEITHRKGFFRNLPLIPGAKEALETMSALGHHVRICTAPTEEYGWCAFEKIESIREHLGEYWVKRTVMRHDKTGEHGDVLIDDKPFVTGEQVPTWEHIRYDQPWNRYAPGRRLTWANYKEVLGL